jgi:cytosine deaminase
MAIPEALARVWMAAALVEAQRGFDEGGVPVGSVIGDPRTGDIVSRGHNRRVLVTTLSPCPMCAGTAVLLQFQEVLIGENRTFQGAEAWLRDAGIAVRVLDDDDCVALMERMQAERPDLWAEDIGH